MSIKVYAMDTAFFHELGDYPIPVRSEILRELGFWGSYLTLWNIKEQAPTVKEYAEESLRNGQDVAGIYATLDLDETEDRDRLLQLLPSLPAGCALELSLKSGKETYMKSSESGDDAALRLLEPLLKAVELGGNPICLYAHINFWLEHHQDSVRLIRKSGHPALGWIFSSYHWYASQEGRLFDLLDEGLPSLRRANFSGSRRSPDGNYTLEPLDSGTLDLSVIFGQLMKRRFAEPIGIQGFGVGGDVYGRLKRGLDILRDWDQRFQRHPGWADLLPPRLPWFGTPGRGPLLVS